MPARDARLRLIRGMTLIEVLASLAIIGIMLAGITSIRGRVVRQWVSADRTIAAVEVADGVLAEWFARGGSGPVTHGTVQGFAWESRELDDPAAAQLGVRIVRLTVRDTDRRRSEPLLEIDTAWPKGVRHVP